jgi:uncharacterized protein (TIGR02453 family)
MFPRTAANSSESNRVVSMSEFRGFPDDFLPFFRDLSAHNERAWFNDNKARYQTTVVEPMLAFIEAMAAPLANISPHFQAIAKAHGGSMFRIYRDTRFAKDKTPYKTHAAAQFRHARGRTAHAPGFYVHLAQDGVFFGGGIWTPPGPQLLAIREFIVDNPAAWRKIGSAKGVQERGGLRGEGLKRPPRGFDPEHEHIEDLKRKSWFIMTHAEADILNQDILVDEVTRAFKAAAPLCHFVCDALEVPF